MKNIFLMMLVSLTFIGCERNDKKPVSSTKSDRDSGYNSRDPAYEGRDNDNTEKNVRDRDPMSKTPLNQSESEVDRTITQKLRQAIVADDSLSTNAKNIKIITINGVVTLRGPVASLKEKDIISRKVEGIQGIVKVENLLEVTKKN